MIQIITQIMDYWKTEKLLQIHVLHNSTCLSTAEEHPPTCLLPIGIPDIHTAFSSILITKVSFVINFETLYVYCGFISTEMFTPSLFNNIAQIYVWLTLQNIIIMMEHMEWPQSRIGSSYNSTTLVTPSSMRIQLSYLL